MYIEDNISKKAVKCQHEGHHLGRKLFNLESL